MNGLYQSVEITIFECPAFVARLLPDCQDSLGLSWSSSQRHTALDANLCYGDTRSKPAISSLMTWR